MSAQADIRKWFLKKPDHDKTKKESTKDEAVLPSDEAAGPASKVLKTPYKKESKYFAAGTGATTPTNGDKPELKLGRKSQDGEKRKSDQSVENSALVEKPSSKKPRLVIAADADLSKVKQETAQVSGIHPELLEREIPPKSQAKGRKVLKEESEEEEYPSRTPARGRGRGKTAGRHGLPPVKQEEGDTLKTPQSAGGRSGKSLSNAAVKSPEEDQEANVPGGGRGRGASVDEPEDDKPTSGRGSGRGGGGGGGLPAWMQPRGIPPNKGKKEVPQGSETALAGLAFVISGTLDSLEREEADFLIKSHGGRVTGSVSKKTDYLLADEDVGGAKSKKAKQLGVKFLTEDELFGMIAASKPKAESNKQPPKLPAISSAPKILPESKVSVTETSAEKSIKKDVPIGKVPFSKSRTAVQESESWPDKYQPRNTADLVANPGIIKQLKDWLKNWEASFLHPVIKGAKGNKRGAGSSSGGEKKAVLLSGTPGIGKTTTARLVCKELGFEALEVNASDSRGKADSKVRTGMGGRTANTIKEMVNNESITFNPRKSPLTVLIMDEVDGMSGGDRGGVADLIASIKFSKVPIICICNDKYNQKLKTLQNYCLALAYRKPTKQQMVKRLLHVAKAEQLEIDEVTLEDIAEQSNGDMRMALNQLQYMSLPTRTLKFSDVHSRLLRSSKDEEMTPFSAADRLLKADGRRLRMDELVDLHMSDMDLVPLLIQENYLNFVPPSPSQERSGLRLMNLAARAALSIAEGDIVNGQIRRRQQWQHSQMGAFMSSIIPSVLMRGHRVEFEGGGRNFNRFPSWLGKNSAFGKKKRLLEDIHVHLLASRICEPTREAIRMGYVPLLALNLSYPLSHLSKETAVKEVVGIMEEYSLNQDDYETVMDISKFKGHPDPLEGVPPAVKTALTKYYKQREQDRPVRSADLLPVMALPGQRKTSQKPKRLKMVSEDTVDGELGTGEADELPDEEGEEGEEEEATEEDGGLDSLLDSNGKIKVTFDSDTQKGTNGQRRGVANSKPSDTKTPKGTKGNKKPAPAAGKRKR